MNVPRLLLMFRTVLPICLVVSVGPGVDGQPKPPDESKTDDFIIAASRGDTDALKKFLDQGIDVNCSHKSGVTALHAARIHGFREVEEFLISRGADRKIPLPPPGRIIDAMIEKFIHGKSPGVAVLVSRGDRVLHRKGYGYASLAHDARITPATKFRIGSITKQFTASAILKLQEDGKLAAGDHLSKFRPDFPRGDEVTLRHLLTHTSGIHSYTDKPDFLTTVALPVEPEVLISSFKDDPFDFSPGKGWHYCNSGYFLLGDIIEKVSSKSYGAFLSESFFAPLGMKATGVHDGRVDLEHEATGYSFEDGEVKKALNWDMSRAGGAGALYSTVDDLRRWNAGVFGGRVLKKKSLTAAHTPVELPEGVQGMPYGLGWIISELRGIREISHGGGLHGFLSHLAQYPEHHLTIVVLSNASPPLPGVAPPGISREIAQIYLWKDMKAVEAPAVDPDVDPATYADYVGDYDYGGAVMTVTRKGDRLFAQLTGQPRLEIFPSGKGKFFWKVVSARVMFVRNEKGKVTKAVHTQGGRTFDAPKLEGRDVARVDPAVYDAYVGKYDYGQGVVMTVTRRGDRLFAQLTGQPESEIFPSSETEFFWKIVNARVKFVRNKQGKVTKGVHTQGGRTFDVPRL